MKAANLFELNSCALPENFVLSNKNTVETGIVNNVEEKLSSQLFVNEIIGEYTHCRLVLDEIVDIQARALQQNINQIIVQNSYEAYFNNKNGNLICLTNQGVAERTKKLFENSFQLSYLKHLFNLKDIISNCSNVKGAKFKNLKIQTVHGGSLNGNQVNFTELYDLMEHNGDLSYIVVSYPFGASEISFSITDAGSIVLFSNLKDAEYIDLIEELRNLTHNEDDSEQDSNF